MCTCTVMAAARCANRSVLMASSNIHADMRICVYVNNIIYIYIYVMRTRTVTRCANRSVLIASSNIDPYMRICVYKHNITYIYMYL